jgi:hypothetical protein
MVKHVYHNDYVYRDWRGHTCHRIVWPHHNIIVYYPHSPWHTYTCVYPYYLRKYVFVSIGGCWPVNYGYVRYYWYGWHPDVWYGYYPLASEVRSDTYNYYTYNYYYGDTASEPAQSIFAYAPPADGIRPVDHNTFADVRQKMALEAAKTAAAPNEPTSADRFFEDAVKAFEKGDYVTAMEKFDRARESATDDMILPFAYAQALFAMEQYSQAAEALREALAKVSPGKEGVFYPRGLYAKEQTLFEQIERLSNKAKEYSFDADLQLLLGYHLLGTGKTQQAIEPLEHAGNDLQNAKAAKTLLELANKVLADNAAQTQNSAQTNKQNSSAEQSDEKKPL